jgi:hypothetical protein
MSQKQILQDFLDASDIAFKEANDAWTSGRKYDAIALYEKALDIVRSSDFSKKLLSLWEVP